MHSFSRDFALAALFWLLLMTQYCSGAEPNSQFLDGLVLLSAQSFTEKEKGIELIGASQDPLAARTLQSLLDGKLFYTSKDNILVYGESEGANYAISDFLSGESLGLVKKRNLEKITINNTLRSTLKTTIALINLQHPDDTVRLAAVNAVLSDINPELLEILAGCYQTEKNEQVRDALSVALAIGGLRQQDTAKRLEALQSVRGDVHPVIKNEIQALIDRETDAIVIKAAKSTLTAIEGKIAWFARLETLFFGLSLGSVLVLAAIGLAITFGVIGVINMAHGELIMLGAYTTYVLQQLMPDSIGLALALSVPAAFGVSGLAGILIERSVIRFLYGRPLETLLATFGISLVLQQTVRSIFSPLNRSVATPDWMSGSITINPILSLTSNRVTIFFFAMLVFGALFLLLKKSSLGLNVRAVAQNRAMARAMGIRAARVDALTFGLGSGIAGIAGVALSQLTNVGPNLGQAYIIDSFMVVVFGGVGNLWGTLLGGLSLGVANKFLEPWSGAVLAKIIILVFIILFIQKRPQGLFPQKGRAAE